MHPFTLHDDPAVLKISMNLWKEAMISLQGMARFSGFEVKFHLGYL
jgi:hypothetical protein